MQKQNKINSEPLKFQEEESKFYENLNLVRHENDAAEKVYQCCK